MPLSEVVGRFPSPGPKLTTGTCLLQKTLPLQTRRPAIPCSVTVDVPAVVGVPEINPVLLFTDNPAATPSPHNWWARSLP
jgi:hypothetical protein